MTPCRRSFVPEFHYRADVLAQLWRHGVQPLPHTTPDLVRAYVRDLYRYEIRRLRDRYVAGEFPKAEYSERVDRLRREYPVLALHARQWVET